MMKQKPTFLLAFIAAIVLLAVAASSQLTVDATGPVRDRLRKPTAGHASSMGRKLSLQIAVDVHGISPDASIPTDVEFVLTNSGKTHFTIPVSPHPGDLEPADAKVAYSVTVLSLYMTSDMKREKKLSGGAELYGSRDWPGTLVSIVPGESVRVLTRVALPPILNADRASETIFIAHAVMDDQAIHTVDGQTIEDTKELGSATSAEYTPHSFLTRRD
jgi:hypothetical protein